MAVALSAKSPSERLDYRWTPALDTGDTITGTPVATVLSGGVTTAGLTVESGATVRLFVEGGTAGETAEIRIVANTVGGRVFEEVLVIEIEAGNALLASFRVRYPEFASVADATVEYWLTDAARYAPTSWGDDMDPARLAYAAHNLSLSGLGTGAALPQGVTSFRSGSFSASLTDAQANATGYDATRYGREFVAIQRRNSAGPFLIMNGRL